MADALPIIIAIATNNPFLSVLALALVAGFVAFFLVRGILLNWCLARFIQAVQSLKGSNQTDPRLLSVNDRRLSHIWSEYCETLHQQLGAINERTGIAGKASYRATVPAEAYFNAQSVFEARIHAEFFKHLPGLLTGLGIIGTFLGLIHGLGQSAEDGGGLNTSLLIASVKEAFNFSAAAIMAAMLITLLEKITVAGLHSRVEKLCQKIDDLYVGGAGEEYLSRLVQASEESASQAKLLKDALVGDLRAILEGLSAKQIEAAARQQTELRTHLTEAIDRGLKQPLGAIADGLNGAHGDQGSRLAEGLKDLMAVFADRLDQVLGGQVGQAKELQVQTLQALEQAVIAFQAMARQVGTAGENATAAISSELGRAIEQMSDRQRQMDEGLRKSLDDIYSALAQAQAETGAGASRLLSELGQHVGDVSRTLHAETTAAAARQRRHAEEMAAAAGTTIAGLAEGVRAQSSAMEQATTAMSAELGRAIEQMADRQRRMDDGMRGTLGEIRAALAQAQAETGAGVGRLIADLGQHVGDVARMLQAETNAATAMQQDRVTELTSASRESIAKLAETVRQQTTTMGEATAAMRGAISELGSSVNRNVALMGDGAGVMHKAAERFASSGESVSLVLDRSRTVATELTQTATALGMAAKDIQAVVLDYQSARETFASIVDAARQTVETAKRDATMTSVLVTRLETAAQKLVEAQGQADVFTEKLSEALADTHHTFTSQLVDTVNRINTEYHQHLARATGTLAGTIAELDGAIVEFKPRGAAGGKAS